MEGFLLNAGSKKEIDAKSERILQDLSIKKPPLDLRLIRELLELDLHYYSKHDPNIFQTMISKLKVASKQILRRPTILLDAIKKCELKALYFPDTKRILIDDTLPPLKHRWNEAHEIAHHLCPWHTSIALGDNFSTLSSACRLEIESEANYFAGRLLFLGESFDLDSRSSEYSFANVKKLGKKYGNSLTSTLWRFVESAGIDIPMVGMVSCHPHIARRPSDFNISQHIRYFIRSKAFWERFRGIAQRKIFESVALYSIDKRRGPIGSSDIFLEDDNGENHIFKFETFFNRYEALTLGVYRKKATLLI